MLSGILALALCAGAPAAEAAPTATAPLVGAGGEDHGVATLTQAPRGVLVRIVAKGLTPGWHAVHFHDTGTCSAPDFKSAGGHVHGSAASAHGLLNPAGQDAGDLPNLFVAQDGTGAAEFFSTTVSFAGGPDQPGLLDADGAALVIHANPDDFVSQPIGGAGARVACGVIR
ncbi:superoxide dismutase family protein [Phenylobacterium sp.]|uniref:superoxide dismutase family protein n=1 Tax=Phenylobacterium sp. TaxID=1871053 RepID=UPI0025EA746E|nr:superoxide dismutase family protein [Phenylobacterium sp.]